jgi:hypothetical protein
VILIGNDGNKSHICPNLFIKREYFIRKPQIALTPNQIDFFACVTGNEK